MIKTKKILFVVIGIAAGLIISKLFIFSDNIKIQDKNQNVISHSAESIYTHCHVFQPEIPDEVFFAGERVPIELFDVREALDRELVVNTYRHSATIIYIKKAKRYFPEIERLLAEHNIPDDMKYLCVAESGLDHVVSPSGAAGFWQFLRNTGREYGMEINDFVDERYHETISLIAATKYLRTAYNRFGTWSLAAAAYNMGMAGLQNQINNQKIKSYWDLHLNQETARYVYRIVALKIIMSDPEKYGFFIPEEYLYDELETIEITVDTSINDLAEFAIFHGTNYKMIRYFNPWIRGNKLPNRTGKQYKILIPAEGVRDFSQTE